MKRMRGNGGVGSFPLERRVWDARNHEPLYVNDKLQGNGLNSPLSLSWLAEGEP